MDKENSSNDSKTKLKEAIGKLEAYSRQEMQSSQDSSVFKTMAQMRSIFASHFDERPGKDRHQQILGAVEEINRSRLLIEKLREGSPADQALAEKITQTIKTYNDSCDKNIQVCVSGKRRLAKFFSNDKQKKDQELPKIALPKKVTIQCHYPEHLDKAFLKINTQSGPAIPLSKQSAELFHMKAITLLERYGIASNPEARNSIKNSPIHITVVENICTLTQTLSLFPGQTIVVMGESALDPKTMSISKLLPESFRVSMESTQTGFPHPIQRAGWTLASQLIPDSPQRVDLLDETAGLFRRRNLAVAGLLEQGALLRHAKELISLKRKAFETYADELIGLNAKLAHIILQATSATSENSEIVENFFRAVAIHPHPFEAFSVTSQIIRENYMVKPHRLLLEAIIKGKQTDLANNSPDVRFGITKTLLERCIARSVDEMLAETGEKNGHYEHAKLKYIECMGSMLGEAAKNIFLQYLSEDLIFSPPDLTTFESKIQTAAYRQLKDFLDELSSPLEGDGAGNVEVIFQRMKMQILEDILLFKGNASLDISKELSVYFARRYASLSALV